MLDSSMNDSNDCGGGERGVFSEATHSLHLHAEHGGGAAGAYLAEGGVVELESEEEPSHSHTPFPPLSNTHTQGHHEGHDSSHEVSHECQHSTLHLPPLAEEHEHPDDELRHRGGPHEHATHGGGAVDEDRGGGGAGGMHEDEHLHFAPASPHSHGVNVVASVESPFQRESV